MSDVFATLIVTAANAPLARSLAGGLSPRAAGMFTAGLSPTGNAPATHYCTSGWMDEALMALLKDSAALYAVCQAKQVGVTQAQCTKLVNESDVTNEQPFSAFARIGISLVNEVIN